MKYKHVLHLYAALKITQNGAAFMFWGMFFNFLLNSSLFL